MNHSARKREIAETLCNVCEQHFLQTKTMPTCIAAICKPVESMVFEAAKKAIRDGYRFSKTAYPFAELGNTKDIFKTAIEKRFISRGKETGLWPY